MKKNTVFILCFLTVLVLPGLLWAIYQGVFVRNKETVLSGENRQMREIRWEELTDSGRSLEDWYNDRAPFRTLFIKGYQKITGRAESLFESKVIPLLSRLFPAETGTGEFLAPKVVGDGVILGRNNWLFLSAANSLDYYKGTNLLSAEEREAARNSLQALYEACSRKGIRLAVLIAPNKEQVYSEYMPSYQIETEYKRTQQLTDYLAEGLPFPVLYPLEELKQGKSFYETYYQYDTHWSYYGGFVGTMMLLKALGEDYTDPFDAQLPGQYEDHSYGDLIQLGGLGGRSFPASENYVPAGNAEAEILREEGTMGNESAYRSSGTGPIREKALVIGDSFRVMMLPYLRTSFAELLCVHRDSWDASYEKDLEDCRILILEAVERFDFELFAVAERLTELLSDR